MNTIARLGSVSVLAVVLSACGGRGIYDFAEDEGGASSDTSVADVDLNDTSPSGFDSGVGEYDAPWWEEDGGEPTFDTSVGPSKDTGVGPSKDTGVVLIDSYVGTDTAVPPDSGTPIATACGKIAAATCSPAFKTCCETSGFTWDSIACDDVSRAWCDGAADGVTAGKTTYNPAWVDACAAGWSANTTSCRPHVFDWVKNYAACSQLFNGKTAVGGTCTRSSDCRAAIGEYAYCDETADRCRTVAVVGLGQTCNYFGAAVRYCDRSLTCAPSTNRCVSATPLGGTCFGADDTACGIGNSCRAGKCAVGAAAGTTCTRDLECASWECEFGKCTDIRSTVASRIQCSGF